MKLTKKGEKQNKKWCNVNQSKWKQNQQQKKKKQRKNFYAFRGLKNLCDVVMNNAGRINHILDYIFGFSHLSEAYSQLSSSSEKVLTK